MRWGLGLPQLLTLRRVQTFTRGTSQFRTLYLEDILPLILNHRGNLFGPLLDIVVSLLCHLDHRSTRQSPLVLLPQADTETPSERLLPPSHLLSIAGSDLPFVTYTPSGYFRTGRPTFQSTSHPPVLHHLRQSLESRFINHLSRPLRCQPTPFSPVGLIVVFLCPCDPEPLC